MWIDPDGEAFVSEQRLAAYRLPVADLAVGKRFAPPTDYIYIAPTAQCAGGWPRPVWRVGTLEGVDNANRWMPTATAFVPVERLEPWRSFGPNGQRVVRIIERIERFGADDLVYLRAHLNSRDEPVQSARIEVPPGQGWSLMTLRDRVVTAAERTDPAAVVDRAWENGYQGDPRSLESPMWEDFLLVAADAVAALCLEIAAERTALLERRFWDLVTPT